MAIYQISPSGNDTTGTGSASAPWKTLAKAISTVRTAGDTIQINAGTYTETQSSSLAVGVNIFGAGASTTIIKSNLTGQWSTLLNLESSSLTNGNQTISGVTFDGQYVSESNYKTWIGIWVTLRSNVILRDCAVINFYDRGVIFNGNGLNDSTIPVDPKIYTVGNKILNCTFTNTARNSAGYIAGQINFSGQNGMEIKGNTMTQTQRVAGKNGELIKYWGSGYNLGCKILNNTLKRLNFSSNQYNGSGDWNFAIELFNQSGLEIAGNNIQGSIDLNYNYLWSGYTYSVWIHDNISDHNPVNTKEEDGIVFEFATIGAIVENNKFLNQAIGITFNMRTPNNSGGYNNPKPAGGYSEISNCIIRNNLFANLYSSYSYGNCCGSAGIQIYTENETKDAYIKGMQIYNNTFVNKTGNAANTGLDFTHFTAAAAFADGIVIRNNIFQGFIDTYLLGGSPKMLNTITKDNDIWQCGNNNNPTWTGALTNTNNQKVNPALDANFLVTPSSPLYGQNIGYQATSTPVNVPPTVNAGPDQTITLPTSSVSLVGTANDSDGSIVSYAWSKTVGGGATIANPSNATTTVTGLVQGSYTFRLTVTDNSGATASDDVNVSVNPVPNTAPTVNAGPDQIITLPTSSVSLVGSASDSDGSIVSYAWTKVSGPAGSIIANPSNSMTSVSGLAVGTHVFRLTVTDNGGATATDTVSIVVNPAPVNVPPTVNAGPDQTITLPTSSVSLVGTANDSDGSIVSYAWTKVSGPAGESIVSSSNATTTVTGLVQGSYTFRLTVTDNSGATASDTVNVIVNQIVINVPPSVDAGPDQIIGVSLSTVLFGSASDSDGSIVSYTWTKVSGPAGGVITAPNNSSTSVTGLVVGTHVFRLTVVDNDGATNSNDVSVTIS